MSLLTIFRFFLKKAFEKSMVGVMQKYAAVGSNGYEDVVWGIGESDAEAEKDAVRWGWESSRSSPELRFEKVDEKQVERIESGEIVWEALASP